MQTGLQVRLSLLHTLLEQSFSPATLTSIGLHALLLLALSSWLGKSGFSTAIVQQPVGVIELTPAEAAQLPNLAPSTPTLSQLFGQAPLATGTASPATPTGTHNLFAGLPSLPGLPPLAPLPVPFPADAFSGLPAPPPVIPLDWYAPPAPARIAVGPPQPQADPVEPSLIIEADVAIPPPPEGGAAAAPPASPTPGDTPAPTQVPTVAATASVTGEASALGGPLAIARADLQEAPSADASPSAPPEGYTVDTAAASGPSDADAAGADYPVDTEIQAAAPPGPVMAPPVTVIVPYPASACPVAASGGYTTVETDGQGNIIAGPTIDLGHPALNAAARSAVLAQPRSLGAAVYQYELSVSGQARVCGE